MLSISIFLFIRISKYVTFKCSSLLLCFPLASQLSLQCIECHIIFSDHKSKERHLKLSHPAEYEQSILRNALFACYVCDRHFTNSSELMAHQKAHTEKKPFKCPICSQAFNKSSELTLHKKIHFGLDGYACTDCGKPCKTMTLLKYHRRTHTGERPYVCKECGKRFTMSKALQKHLVSHSSEGAEGDGGDTTVKAQLKKDDGNKNVHVTDVLSFEVVIYMVIPYSHEESPSCSGDECLNKPLFSTRR